MTGQYDVVSLGDVNLDYVVGNNLPFKFSSLIENGTIWWDEILEIPGGSGLNFCIFAKKEGYHPLLLSKVGGDTAGIFITDWLKAKNVSVTSQWASNKPTGKAIIMRDNADIRLLINNKQNANHFLSIEDIEDHKEHIASCQVLYVSGYCVSDPTLPRFDATLKAMKYARQQGSEKAPSIVFDVVPHKIYEKVSFDEFLAITQNVDILISEVSTIRRFLGLGSKSETIDHNMAEDSINRMTTYYNRLILRFGPSGCDEQFLWDKNDNKLLYNKTGHKNATDKRGFGDLLTIKALQNFFQVLSPIPDQTSTSKFVTN